MMVETSANAARIWSITARAGQRRVHGRTVRGDNVLIPDFIMWPHGHYSDAGQDRIRWGDATSQARVGAQLLGGGLCGKGLADGGVGSTGWWHAEPLPVDGESTLGTREFWRRFAHLTV